MGSWTDILLKILAALGISRTLMFKAFSEILANAGDPGLAKELAWAWWEENVDPLLQNEASATWRALFEDTWEQFQSGSPGENPHHGGIA